MRFMPAIPLLLLAACRAPFESAPPDPLPEQTFGEPPRVESLVLVEGEEPVYAKGLGIVTGLNGAGDSPKGESARMLFNMMKNMQNADVLVMEVNARNMALVMINAEIPAFQKKGSRVDVTVSCIGDACSLAGGILQAADLHGLLGRKDPYIYAIAAGRVIIESEETSGIVPNGAILEKDFWRKIVKQAPDGRSFITLLLKRADPIVAAAIARQLNSNLFRYRTTNGEMALRVARVRDAGAIDVFVPDEKTWARMMGTAHPRFDTEPTLFVARVLEIKVPLRER